MNGDVKAMALGTCGSCHLPPDPADLPYGIWDTVVLPRMGYFLGRYPSPGLRDELLTDDPAQRAALLAGNVFPERPRVDDADWAAIRRYYLDRAPRELPATAFSPVAADERFTARFPDLYLSPPSVTFARSVPGRGFVVGDVNKASLFLLDDALKPTARLPAGRGLTDATGFAPGDVATVLGSFSPTDAATGSLLRWTAGGPQTLADDLQRPTSLVRLDTDADGRPEYIVTEYGKWTGRLSLWHEAPDGSFSASSLADRSGALAVSLDSLADVPTVYVLFGQGKEEIVRYRFPAHRPVQRTRVRALPPSYGSSSLQTLDWNEDGITDLLYTNGDNADYVSPVKPYHGIRLYLGEADGAFTEAFFLPFPGAYAARVADFDGDGRKDIAAISFFPDYHKPQPTGAALFYQTGPNTFTAHPLPAAGANRYLVLDAADHDGDGDVDLMAGCLALEAVPDGGRMERWVKNGLGVVVWENAGSSSR